MNKSIATFLTSIIIIALMASIAVFGFNAGVVQIPSVRNGVRLGLELVGGSVITYEAQIPSGMSSADIKSDMQVAQTMLQTRLNGLGLTEATIAQEGDRRLRIEIPTLTNPEDAVKTLGSTAQLEFRDSSGKVALTGKDVKKAVAKFGSVDNGTVPTNYVELTFTSDGVSKFADVTKRAAQLASSQKNYVEIVLDGKVQSSPSVDAKYASTGINSDTAVITLGNGSAQDAKNLANIISSGQLPFSLKNVGLQSIGPTLGETALNSTIFAGMLGLIIVIIFMIAVYRLPGFIAGICLVFYTTLLSIVLSLFRINLSLPGIAGIILSIGISVDANVIIFERLKEELRAGKTLRAAIDAGFTRALTAIIDSNVTTILSSIVLLFLGTGPIIGFAITLVIGVVLSMFTALIVTRFLLNHMVGMNIKNIKAYGA